MTTDFVCSLSPTNSHLVLSLNKFAVLDVTFNPDVHFETFMSIRNYDSELENLDERTLKLMQMAYTVGMNQAIDRIAHEYLSL